MSKFITFLLLIFLNLSTFAAIKTIEVLVPMQHTAMDQIVEGITESFSAQDDVNIVVKNANGDNNIMLSLIKQMAQANPNIIMPIGTTATQMTIAHVKNIPIVAVAALVEPNIPMVTGLYDEVSITQALKQLQSIKDFTVIYSASEKVIPEINELKAYAKEQGLTLSLRMASTMSDLPSAVKSAPNDTEAFVVLKDHLIVSGVNIILQEAEKRKIPVIASDEGSVLQGATIAIGVKEKQIGIESGKMALMILEGKSPNDILPANISSLVLFINNKAFKKQSIINIKELKAIKLPNVELN